MLLQRPIVQGINLQNIGLVLYAAIIVTGLGYLFYFLAIDASNAITGSVTFLLKPVIAPLAAFLVLQEKPGPMGLLGIGLVLAASIINLKALQHNQN
jgi:drug/metabolite transporter (DMT)-like permease